MHHQRRTYAKPCSWLGRSPFRSTTSRAPGPKWPCVGTHLTNCGGGWSHPSGPLASLHTVTGKAGQNRAQDHPKVRCRCVSRQAPGGGHVADSRPKLLRSRWVCPCEEQATPNGAPLSPRNTPRALPVSVRFLQPRAGAPQPQRSCPFGPVWAQRTHPVSPSVHRPQGAACWGLASRDPGGRPNLRQPPPADERCAVHACVR